MKTTNMNNNNASVEATTSENIYIATKVRTDVWEERTEIKITAFECSSMATITEMYAKNNELSYVVENLATGEQRTYDGNEICEWCTSQTLDNMVDYRITYTGVWDTSLFLGKDVYTHEVYFTRVKRCDLPSEVVHPLWLLEVSNADTNEVVACNWFETSGAMLAWVDKQILDWRYTEAGVVNHRIYANGYDITPNFRARDRKRYTLSACSRYRSGIDITIDTYCYPSVAKKGKKKFFCSICGEEHFVEEGTFLPHPVRPNKDSDGRYNYCCAACYEKYVGPMHAACWVTSSWRENIERINNIHISVGEGRFYKLSVSELDTIIRLEKLREEGMAYLRLYEHRNAEREAIKLRNKSQSRRMQAVRAAKQAKKTK